MGHFETDRVDSKMTRVAEQGLKFKKQTAAQQTKQKQLQPAVTGLIPQHGKLAKSRNQDDLRIELLFREVPAADMPVSMTDRKAKLKQHAFNWLFSTGMEATAANAQANK